MMVSRCLRRPEGRGSGLWNNVGRDGVLLVGLRLSTVRRFRFRLAFAKGDRVHAARRVVVVGSNCSSQFDLANGTLAAGAVSPPSCFGQHDGLEFVE